MSVDDRFQAGLDPYWRTTEQGQGAVRHEPGLLRLLNRPTPDGVYTNAQISDYQSGRFRWRPPLRLTVTARASSSSMVGTAGFGFWNHPFTPVSFSLRLPQAIWFFYGGLPTNIALAKDVPGHGWKAATISANRWPFLLLAPTTPLAVFLMRVPALYNLLWPIGQRAIGVSEKRLDSALLAERHTYTLEWQTGGASWAVDGRLVHEAAVAPSGPLGFVAWVDNQYAIVTPQGQFGYGVTPLEHEQSLKLEHVSIQPL